MSATSRCWGSRLCIAALTVGIAQQSPAQPGLAPVPETQQNRDRAYAALARDVEALDRLLGLVNRVAKLVTPSVVHIEAPPLRELRVRSGVQEAGSGVVVQFAGGEEKFILTNRHVVKNSSEPYIRIFLNDGRRLRPSRIWSDPQTDVAIMRVADQDLLPARVGNSDALEIGDPVLAFGSPFGLSESVTRGIISAKGRYNLDLGDGALKYQNFLQTDAAINPGNSGGPLINLRGEVVGLNTAIASNSGGNEGIGFSIPINIATRIGAELARTGEVRRGYLGVTLDVLFDEDRARAAGLAALFGTRIKSIEPNSPAERAELHANDIIIEYAGVRIEDDDHLISMVKLTKIGKQVNVLVYRHGERLRRLVQIGEQSTISQARPE